MGAFKYWWAALMVCFALSCAKKAPEAEVSSDQPVQKTTRTSIEQNEIKYTYKAFCQMRCNKYRTMQIKEAIRKGKYRTRNEWMSKKPCPFYAVEHEMTDGNKLYLFLAACDHSTKIVRVYDSRKLKCDCPPMSKSTTKS